MSETHETLKTKPVKQVFFQYFFPALFGMMLMSINILIDGIFVGRGVGEEGLAGVNLAMPVFSLIFSISLWIGIGGGTVYSMHIGREEPDKARNAFSLSTASSLVILAVIGTLGYLFIEPIAYMLGANADTFGSYRRLLDRFISAGLVDCPSAAPQHLCPERWQSYPVYGGAGSDCHSEHWTELLYDLPVGKRGIWGGISDSTGKCCRIAGALPSLFQEKHSFTQAGFSMVMETP